MNSPIKSESPAMGEMVVLKTGMFPRIPAPESEAFGAHRQEWEGWHPEVTVFKIKRGEEKLDGVPEH